MPNIIIRSEIDNLTFYNLTTGLQSLNPDSTYKIEELYEVITQLVESGELDALVLPLELKLLSLDKLEIEINNQAVDTNNIKLKNQNIQEFVDLSEDQEGELYLLRHYVGDGEFSYEVENNFKQENITFNYLDCSQNLDQFDLLRESYLESMCDMVIANNIKYNNQTLEFDDFIFEPQTIKDELYIVKKDMVTDENYLEKLDVGGNKLFGTDCDIDDFERN